MANALELIEKEKLEKTGYLDLGYCGLTEWPDLSDMDWLHTLILSNEWFDLEIGGWKRSKNEGEGNVLHHVPNKSLPLGLKELVFGGEEPSGRYDYCLINDGSFLASLTQLTSLNIGNNRISKLAFLAKLTHLTHLNLTNNQISDISILKELKALTMLDISYNHVNDISCLTQLTKLTRIGLMYNKIIDISPLEYFIVDKNLPVDSDDVPLFDDIITIRGNPIENPPISIVQEGNNAILEYFHQKKEAGIDLLLEAKLILLGDGRSGKTSLANRLLGKELPKEEDRTQGVDIVIGEYGFPVANGKNFKLNIWDFAGQDKYKPLHQFFYTESSVYVMVAPSGNGTTDFDDWLQTAELFGEGSPLIILLNEFKDGIGFGSFDVEAWKRRFPNLLKEVYCVNLGTMRGFEVLQKHLHLLAEALPHTKEEYPANWAAIRRELEGRRDENFISLQEYLRVCEVNNLPEEKSALILSSILTKVGTCLHYQGNPLLEQYVILKNEWATTAVYKILEDKAVAEDNKGFFTKADLERIWSDKEYRHMRPQLLELMCQFRMAYPLPQDKGYITPPLLSTAPPHHWAWTEDKDIELRLEYEFMPKAMMTQFIVSRYLDIDEGRKLVWRNGVVLRWDGAVAEVVKTKSQGLDAMIVRCQGREKKALMTSILKTFRDLHEEYKGIKVSENVPCICEGCRSGAHNLYFFKFENLKNRIEKGRTVVECERSLEEVNILEMVGEVLVLQQRGEGRSIDIKPIPISGKDDNGHRISFQHSKAELQDILIEGDFHSVLNLLKTRLPRETHVIINLLAQLNELNDRLAIGNISEDNAGLKKSKIRNSVLQLIEKLD